MKKIIAVILALVLAVAVCGCGKETTSTTAQNQSSTPSSTNMQTVLDQNEYTLYQNIFFNNMANDYVDKPVIKKGTFTSIIDAYNGVTRYYVWGYMDQTKCCDFQWELEVTDTSNLPSNGSLVEVSGTFTQNKEKALDGYWITNPQITLKSEYKGLDCDIDMTTMNGTLERVQVQNIQYKSEQFNGKTVAVYGRVKTMNSIQHPYSDDAFVLEFSTSDSVPAIGSDILVQGKVSNGGIENAKISNFTA